ncbi:RNA endoribonuclease [Chamberlinius hualienensis]
MSNDLEQFRGNFTNDEPMDVSDSSIKKLYIILDTNILLSDLALVDDIKKKKMGSIFPVVYVIPWVVLQELDLLKSDKQKNPNLKPLAIKAINYLFERFKRNDPQFRGQSATESKKVVSFKAESNDDRILQCCMYYILKFDGDVVIFSNDKNMANKALVHSINVCSNDDICTFLERVILVPDVHKGDSVDAASTSLTDGFGSAQNLKEILNLSCKFLSFFEQHSTYDGRLVKVLKKIENFKERLENRLPTVKTEIDNQSTLTNSALTSAISSSINVPQSREIDTVKSALDFVWNVIKDSCGLILDCFGISNPIVYNRPAFIPTSNNANIFLQILCQTLRELKFYLKSVTVGEVVENTYQNFCCLLKNFTTNLGLRCENVYIENLTPAMIKDFTLDPNNRVLIQCGLQELDRFIQLVTF